MRKLDDWLGGTTQHKTWNEEQNELDAGRTYIAKYSAAPSPQTVIIMKKSKTPTLVDKGNTPLART